MKVVGKRDTAPDFPVVGGPLAGFVDGCFWLGGLRRYVAPVDNVAFRQETLCSSRAKDRIVEEHLENHGWEALRMWEDEVNWWLRQVAERANWLLEQRNANEVREVPRVRHA